MKILVDNMPDKPQQCLCANRRNVDGWLCMFTHRVCKDTSKCRYLKVRKGDIHVGGSTFLEAKECYTSDVSKLNPCSCGCDEPEICKNGNTFAALYYIKCKRCEYETENFASVEEAIEDWNITNDIPDLTDIKLKQLLPATERLCQLAEEASELSQAALKLRRVIDGTNPTPKTYEEARASLVEEYADVMCVIDLIICDEDRITVDEIIKKKKKRWIGRIKEARGE